MIDDELRFIRITFKIQGLDGRSVDFKDSVYSHYQKIADDINLLYPRGISTCFQIPYDQWAYLSLEKAMFKNAIVGMFTSILFAWLVLLIITMNLIVSF